MGDDDAYSLAILDRSQRMECQGMSGGMYWGGLQLRRVRR